MAANESILELKKDGISYEMAIANLSTTNIGLVFGLDPKTIWLKDGTRCYFPVGEVFPTLSEFCYTLVVKGTPTSAEDRAQSRSLSATLESPASSAHGMSSASGSSSYRGLGGGRNCVVKIVKAEKDVSSTGKVTFTAVDQMFIDVSPTTANIDYVQSEVMSNWGPGYNVVSNDGLKITDSAATRGIKFWKVGSRKYFAVKEKGREKGKGKKRRRQEDSSDDETQIKINSKLDLVNAKVSKLMEVNRTLPLPLGLISILSDTFKCTICLGCPISPPVILGKCCNRIVGCQQCVDGWYREDTLNKRCPLCQQERGYTNTMIILGFDEFLQAIAEIMKQNPASPQAVAEQQHTPHVPPAPVSPLDINSSDEE